MYRHCHVNNIIFESDYKSSKRRPSKNQNMNHKNQPPSIPVKESDWRRLDKMSKVNVMRRLEESGEKKR